MVKRSVGVTGWLSGQVGVTGSLFTHDASASRSLVMLFTHIVMFLLCKGLRIGNNLKFEFSMLIGCITSRLGSVDGENFVQYPTKHCAALCVRYYVSIVNTVYFLSMCCNDTLCTVTT